MKTTKSLYYWFALFALCFIAYQQVQDNIRPAYTGGNLTIIYLLGIAPNFFPAIGIPALFIVIIPQMKWTNKWLNEKKHITANLISLAGLLSCDGNVVRVQVPSGVPAKSSLSEMKGFFVLKRLRNNC